MTRRPAAALAMKEARALLPVWLVSIAGLVAASVAGRAFMDQELLVFAVGGAALGAWPIGHELTHGTLGPLLVQPVRRRTIYGVKLAVLLAALATLALAARVALASPGVIGGAAAWTASDARFLDGVLVLGALTAFAAGPVLTMACRSTLGGAVFTLALPALLWLSPWGGATGPDTGIVGDEPARAIPPAVIAGLAVCWPLFTAAGWWAFARLNDREGTWWSGGSGRDARTVSSTRRRSAPAIVWLIRKELHLQFLTFAVSGLYLLAWLALTLKHAMDASSAGSPLPAVTVLHGLLVPLIAGAVASADERQMGTIEWQALLPMTGRRQWTVKVVTVLGVAIVLAVGLPLLLGVLHPADTDLAYGHWTTATVAMLALIALYVSSTVASPVSALLVSMVAALGATVMLVALSTLFGWLRVYEPGVAVAVRLWKAGFGGMVWALGVGGLGMCLLLVAGPLVWFGARNHASAQRGGAHLRRQVWWLCVSLATAVLVTTLLEPISSMGLRAVGTIRTR